MVEFTGERVIPGQVKLDLWNEHLARYAFSVRFAGDKRVLDCGCGAGYGTAELARVAATAVGVDSSPEAIAYAHANYSSPHARFIAASCLDLPFAGASFDLVVAFEVIEHLSDFRRFLDETARVLTPEGLLIVSTPNKSYYAESRAKSGPNPFHEHEFEATEFQSELSRHFPNVTQLLQNRAECFVFSSPSATNPLAAQLACADESPDSAHFFVALCSRAPLPTATSFVYIPRSANLLREREQHIQLLEKEVGDTHGWLTQTQQDRDRLLGEHRDLLQSHEEQNRWAKKLDADLKTAFERIEQLQREFGAEQEAAAAMSSGYQAKILNLEKENISKTNWAHEIEQRLAETEQQLGAEIVRVTQDLTECHRLLQKSEETVLERTVWARSLEAEKLALEAKLSAVRASRWVKLGRKMGLGPAVE